MAQTFKTPNDQAQDLIKKEETWKEKQARKPSASTPEQMNALRNRALRTFGSTDRYDDAFYMLPNGQMLSGTGGQNYGRVYDHRDINQVYGDEGVDLAEIAEGGNSTNMLDFMRGGNIRMIPETRSIDIMSKPTTQQMNRIYEMWKKGKLDGIQISDPKTKSGSELEFIDDIRNEAQISNLIRKYFI